MRGEEEINRTNGLKIEMVGCNAGLDSDDGKNRKERRRQRKGKKDKRVLYSSGLTARQLNSTKSTTDIKTSGLCGVHNRCFPGIRHPVIILHRLRRYYNQQRRQIAV